jgi:endonuclease IV
MVAAADRAIEIGASALQIFSGDPTAWRRRAAPSPEIPAFRARLAGADIAPLVIHASYLVNLAGSDPAYHERSVAMLAAELRTARRLGASIVNVHIGSHGGLGREVGIERVVTSIRRAVEAEAVPETAPDDETGPAAPAATAAPSAPHERAAPNEPGPPATIALENSAGSGSGLGVDVDELARIAEALDAAGIDGHRVAFCLDTAHAWSAGHDLADPAAIDDFVDDFDRRLGLAASPSSTSTIRSPSGGRGSIATSTSGPGGSARSGWPTCSGTRVSPEPRGSSRRRGWTWATTRSTSRGPSRSRVASRSCRSRTAR